MSDVNDIYNEAAEKWSANKGIGSVILSEPLSLIGFIVQVLDRMVAKTPKLTSLIIVESIADRANFLYYLENTSKYNEIHKNLIADKYCVVFTRDYVEHSQYKPSAGSSKDILVTINVKRFKGIIDRYGYDYFKFRLLVCNDVSNVADNAILMYKYAPKVYSVNYANLLNRSVNSPVKEIQKAVILDEATKNNYDKATKYINESITIFGSFEKLDECRVGNPTLNLAAETCRVLIAESNGWNAKMDMTDPMYQKIDAMYNPNSLAERASNVYNVLRERKKLVSDALVKLPAILDIVNAHKGERVLIISLNGQFASKVTDYLVANVKCEGKSIITNGEIFQTGLSVLQYPYCMDYHNDMEAEPAYDQNGRPKVYKTGQKRGQPIIIKAKAQRTRNLELFNDDYVKVLSANNAIDTAFMGVVDVVIFTSPLCSSIRDLKYRIPNLTFSSVPNLIYKVYAKETIEEKKVLDVKGGKDYEIVKECEDEVIIGEI